MNEIKKKAGRLGGMITFVRYGSDQKSQIGARGGQPKNPALEQLRQLPAPDDPLKTERRERLPLALRGLKGLRKLRNTDRGSCTD